MRLNRNTRPLLTLRTGTADDPGATGA